MRVGMAGLAALYWPLAIGEGLRAREGVEFLAAATLGASETAVRQTLGISAADYAARFGLKLYDQPEDMVAAERLDTLVLVSRHSEHAAWVERLAPLGTHLFIPKTFATTLADADRIVAAGERHGVRIAVGPSARYLPEMVAARQAVERGCIGRPFALRILHHHGTIDGFGADDWYRDPQEGGPELSLGWYGIDLARHLMDDDVAAVWATYGNFATPDSPFMDCGRIGMEMRGGGIASFDMLFCLRVPYPAWQVEIVGPGGVVSVHRAGGDAQKVVVSLDGAAGHETLPLPDRTPGWETFWVDDLAHGREAAISAREARTITRISLAARDSARRGRPVSL